MKRFIIPLLLVGLVVLLPGERVNAAPDGSPFVLYSEKNDSTPDLRSVKPIPLPAASAIRETFLGRLDKATKARTVFSTEGLILNDTVVQSVADGPAMPSTSSNFEGIYNQWSVYPPDTNGAVGPNHYVQTVNLGFRIWDKNGNSLYGPANINTLWSGFGGECESENNGDPIVLYDHLADRWIISQFALGPSYQGPYYQCIAISQTGDPTGAWYRYAFLYSNTLMNDYPKFGVWPDGYYMSVNQFNMGSSWAGAGVVAFERNKMLNGQTARMVYFNLYSANSCFGGLLPSDLDGPAPPAGTPNYFASMDDGSWNCSSSSDHLKIWQFHVDWATPANSTFGINGQPNALLNTAPFDLLPCTGRNCIAQPGVASNAYLDALDDRLMYRLQYRNFGTYAGMVTNHTVNAGGGRAGIRWYELHNSGSGWSIYQQGTYAPADTENRWMGSIAMDAQDNIALGYSVSSSSVYPSIRYAGRLKDDPLGTLPQSESTIINGSGSQTGTAGRWGDYSMMDVDPTDGCTFWYTTEYYQTTGTVPWRTRIASFQFPGCKPGKIGYSPTYYDFGNVFVGNSQSETFTVSNTGAGNLTIGTVSVTDANFIKNSDNCSNYTLTPGAYCSLQVLFAPQSYGWKYGYISIPSNDPMTPVANIDMNGTGQCNSWTCPPGGGYYGGDYCGNYIYCGVDVNNGYCPPGYYDNGCLVCVADPTCN